ncbi:MAG: ATP-binding cassette domain-containing protein, partial [Clostridiales bacterium]|nr:ATP-binding cassette domain-containing protein [Clostridiales bacterium]
EIEPLPVSARQALPTDNGIELKNVTYRYKDATRDAVNGVSLRIEPGEHIALVGPSGSGKTTLAELMVRFFDVDNGQILVGGADVKDIDPDVLMKKISFVFQDSRLIKKSIFENVRLSKPDATEEEVIAALTKAQCMDIIDKLPDGIHTVIGEKGTYLSGGEQQRITIARAVLKDAPILILDEATAFADPDNETKVQAAFDELSKDKTVVMIAHRLSTVMNADKIYVLDDGRLTEYGTHKDLMNTDGLYKKMFDEYTRSVEWKVGA